MKQKLYTVSATETLISDCVGKGYDVITLDEGCLGVGHLVCLAPDDRHWNFEISEIALNEWNSAQRIRRFRKLSKRLEAEINETEFNDEERMVGNE